MGGGGSEGGGGNMKRAPQSAQSVPNSHWAAVPNSSKSEPGPPSWQATLFANAHALLHHIGGGEGGGEGGGGEGGGGEGGGGEGGGGGGAALTASKSMCAAICARLSHCNRADLLMRICAWCNS